MKTATYTSSRLNLSLKFVNDISISNNIIELNTFNKFYHQPENAIPNCPPE